MFYYDQLTSYRYLIVNNLSLTVGASEEPRPEAVRVGLELHHIVRYELILSEILYRSEIRIWMYWKQTFHARI